ncbi:unnamed protein product, partial [Ectocarpus sp. 12 AP-2014]
MLRVRHAIRRWKHAARITPFLKLLQCLEMRGALHRWKRELERRATCETANKYHSRALLSKVWKAWVVGRFNAASDNRRLQEAMKRWHAWQKWWKTRLDAFHLAAGRRVLASAVRHWRLEIFASRCRRNCLEKSFQLLRKCLVALAENAHSAVTLRRLLESHRTRHLRDALGGWRWWLSLEAQKRVKKAPTALTRENKGVNTTGLTQRLHP